MKTAIIVSSIIIGVIIITILVIYFADKKKPNTDGCGGSCGIGYVCVNNKCVRPGACNPPCSSDEICLNKVCHKKTECEPACKDTEICVKNKCVNPDVCDPECQDGYTCKNQVCVYIGGGGHCSEDTDCPLDYPRCVNGGASNSYCTKCESHFDCTEDNPVCLNPREPNSICVKCRNSTDCSGTNVYETRKNTYDFPSNNLNKPVPGLTEELAKVQCDKFAECTGFTMKGGNTQFKGTGWNPFGTLQSHNKVDLLSIKKGSNICVDKGTNKARCVSCIENADCQHDETCSKNMCYNKSSFLDGRYFVMKNIKNGGCLTHVHSKGLPNGPIHDLTGVFCDNSSPNDQSVWKFITPPPGNVGENIYIIQNVNTKRCLTNERWYNYNTQKFEVIGDIACDPENYYYEQPSLWKVIPTDQQDTYVFQNVVSKACLTHANGGNGDGPIDVQSNDIFCNPDLPNHSEQSVWLLKEVKNV